MTHPKHPLTDEAIAEFFPADEGTTTVEGNNDDDDAERESG